MAYFIRVATPNGDVRDYVNRAATGAILEQGPNRYAFINQEHHAHSLTGYVQFSNIPGGNVCTAPGPTCIDPGFTDSLESRTRLPPITDWVEFATTKSNAGGLSGTWSVPFAANTERSPYKARLTASNSKITVALAATGVTSQYCAPFSPPCGNSTAVFLMFGPNDTDMSVYGHEFVHGLLNYSKFLRSQVGPDGQLNEGLCDAIGTGFEHMALAYASVCAPTDVCHSARSDFFLSSPSNGIAVDMRLPSSTCGTSPRSWMGRSFLAASKKLAFDLFPIACPPNALCGWPAPAGGFYGEEDWGIEMVLASTLYSFEVSPNFQPNPSDFLAATLATSLATSSGEKSATRALYDELNANRVGCP